MKPKTLIVITGPTASGKSALAIDIALKLDTEIISADSRQIYQGIPIVTAMPTAEQRAAVPHHLVDMLPLQAYYSASTFEQDAVAIAGRIFQERDHVVVCGGSMMYIDALCNGIDILPTVTPAVRESLKAEHAHLGDDWLRSELMAVDPTCYASVDLNNIRRVFHAVEITRQAGRPYSSLIGKARPSHSFRVVKIFLDLPRETLFDRINRRVEQMVEEGLEEEIRRVLPLRGLNSLNTVGVKEMFAYFDGHMSFDEAVARIQKNTRVYAKKQITWFARDPEILHMSPEEVRKYNRW